MSKSSEARVGLTVKPELRMSDKIKDQMNFFTAVKKHDHLLLVAGCNTKLNYSRMYVLDNFLQLKSHLDLKSEKANVIGSFKVFKYRDVIYCCVLKVKKEFDVLAFMNFTPMLISARCKIQGQFNEFIRDVAFDCKRSLLLVPVSGNLFSFKLHFN